MFNFVQGQVEDPGLRAGEDDPALTGLTTPVRSAGPTGQADTH